MITEEFMKNDEVTKRLVSFFNIKEDINIIENFKEDISLTKEGRKLFDCGIKTSFEHYIKENVDVDQKILQDAYDNVQCFWTTKKDKMFLMFVVDVDGKYYYFGLNEDYWNVNISKDRILQ